MSDGITHRRVGRAAVARMLLASLSVVACGCPVQLGVNPIQTLFDTPPAAPSGYVAVIYLNRSSILAQTIVTLTYPQEPPLVWVNAITPDSWDSLLVESGVRQIELVGVVPVDLDTSLAGDQVDYTGSALVADRDIVCGSTIVVEINDNPADGGGAPITIAIRTLPASLSGTEKPKTSPTAPGPESGLVLLRPVGPSGVPISITASWEDADGLVYASTWQLAGTGPSVGALIECPVVRAGWGNVAHPDKPGAIVEDQQLELVAPPPLVAGTDFACGDAITLRAEGSDSSPDAIQLTTEVTSSGAEVRSGEIDLFGSIRSLLDQEGFAGKLSNSNALVRPEAP